MKKAVFSAIILTLAAVLTTSAATRHVPTEYPTIQAAIDDANNGDVVMLQPDVYSGPGNTDIDFNGKALIVCSTNPDDPSVVAATIIDCNARQEPDPNRAFYFHHCEGPDSVVNGLTIINGKAEFGGAVLCDFYTGPVIKNCVFNNNNAAFGGAIACLFSLQSAVIKHCTFAANAAERCGGAIYCYRCVPRIVNCSIRQNTAAEDGGGIYADEGSSPTVTDSNIISNTARYGCGGGISFFGGLVTRCNIRDNFAVGGGGVYFHYPCIQKIVRQCTVTNNVARGDGGGVFGAWRVSNSIIAQNRTGNNGGGLAYCREIINCIITRNAATRHGGGAYGEDEFSEVANCTLVANAALSGHGGAIALGPDASAQSLPCPQRVINSILWGNTATDPYPPSAQLDGLYNVTFCCIQDDDPKDTVVPFYEPDANNIYDYPVFVRYPDNGGDGWGDDPRTPDVNEGANDDFGDLHLMPNSPCLDAGGPCGQWCFSRDVDNQPRVMGENIEIGADEYLVPWIAVTAPAAGDLWPSGSLREIRWESFGLDTYLIILLSTDAGATWKPIRPSLPDTGSYTWPIPDTIDSNNCIISIVPRDPYPGVICTPSETFAVAPDCPGPDVPTEWKSLGGGFDHTNLSKNRGPQLGCIKWTFQTEGLISAPVTIGPCGRIHIACESGKLYTLDATGAHLWTCPLTEPLISVPIVGPDGTIYVGGEHGTLFAVDIDGNLRWTQTTQGFIYACPAISPDGHKIFVAAADGNLYALGRDGTKLWSFCTAAAGPLGSAILSPPAVAPDGTVYTAGFMDSNLYALEPNDGSVKWTCHFDSAGRPLAAPVIAPDGSIYQTLLYEPNLYAIDPCSGNIRWRSDLSFYCEPYTPCHYDPRPAGWYEPALAPDGTIYVSLADPYLHAVNPDGTVKWDKRLGTTEGFALTVAGDGLIYAAGDDADLTVLDPNGNELARLRSNVSLLPPVIAADGTIITSDSPERIIAIAAAPCPDDHLALHRPQDLDGNLMVNFADFAIIAADWLACTNPNPSWPQPHCDYQGLDRYLTGDIDRSLYIDFADLAALTDKWLTSDQKPGI